MIPTLPVLENVVVPVAGHQKRSVAVARGRELLQEMGLGDRAEVYPAQLSGGQQQRVAIAPALMVDPVLLLADEPTGNLDSSTAAHIMDALYQAQRLSGTTLMIATHDPSVVAGCDRQVHIRDGALTAEKGGGPHVSQVGC